MLYNPLAPFVLFLPLAGCFALIRSGLLGTNRCLPRAGPLAFYGGMNPSDPLMMRALVGGWRNESRRNWPRRVGRGVSPPIARSTHV